MSDRTAEILWYAACGLVIIACGTALFALLGPIGMLVFAIALTFGQRS